MPMEPSLSYSVVTKPDALSSPAVVVYGGLYGMEGGWFLSHRVIPENLQQRLLFVLPCSFETDCQVCIREVVERVVKTQTRQITSWSICGFSAGGAQVYRNIRTTNNWGNANMNDPVPKILGLIDPSPPTICLEKSGDGKPPRFDNSVLDSVAYKVRGCVPNGELDVEGQK